ncbi:retinaldehyde-binding protein 1-like [Argiope bruennichi]|uniref:retinaldehyde-binding protein 1-like n=1 Tax=Argiope bruennichi TaxID=94029 RepID=UPI00249478EA|nr:retinaldehyde-binding protein 1-like [Argiope bruennichi]
MPDEREVLPFQMKFFPEFVLQKAIKELNETPDRKIEGRDILKKLLSTHKLTCDINFDDDYLTLFLRHSKYNANKAFIQIQNYIRLREKYKTLFESVPDEYFFTIPSTMFGTILPYRSPDGCTMVLCELGKWDPDELSIDNFKRLALQLFIQTLRDPMTQINGFKIIHDFKGTSMKHLKHCTPQNLYFQYHAAIDCIPGRYKEIHFVNESILLKTLWSIVRNFISKKMRSRVFFHSNPEDLLNYFPPSILPVQYGGELTDYYQEDLVRKLNKEYGNAPVGGEPNYF